MTAIAAQPSKSRRYHALLAVALSVVTIPLTAWHVYQLADRFDTPQTAMIGFDHVDASWSALCSFAGAALWLGLITLYVGLGLRRWRLAAIPLVTLPVLYDMIEMGIERHERNPVFHANFAASRTALDALADRVLRGESPALPCMAASFEIIQVERVDPATIVLYTQLYPEARMKWGFVRAPNVPGTPRWAGEIGLPQGGRENNCVDRLSGDWFVLFDCYRFTKRGWS